MSIVEIGGAYAQRFYKFLDFLELQTLVITDLDSVKAETKKDKNDMDQTSYPACRVGEGLKSSNTGISNWFGEDGYMCLATIQGKSDKEKVAGKRRLCFQIPEEGSSACARSFEDAFMLANKKLFQIEDKEDDSQSERSAFEKSQKIGKDSKADFAIRYAIDETEWVVPKYIEDGLKWLASPLEVAKETSGDSE